MRIIMIPLLALVLASGCVQDPAPGDGGDGQATMYSMAEVAEHDTPSDCWTIIHGKVYDVTSFINSHPGGEAILQDCGRDGTEFYESRPVSGTSHSQAARNLLDSFYIGDLEG